MSNEFIDDLDRVLAEMRATMIDKNRKYGDSALSPVRIFSKANSIEQIRVRLDDKISRMASGQQDEDEDVEQDLMGYLLLLRIARRRVAGSSE